MAYEEKDLRGAIFKNSRKNSDNSPDYKGSCRIDGRDYWISGWIKEPREGGAKFQSLSFQPKEERQRRPPPSDDDTMLEPREPDDDVPF